MKRLVYYLAAGAFLVTTAACGTTPASGPASTATRTAAPSPSVSAPAVGNGVDAMTATQATRAALAALSAARTARIRGTAASGGESLALDMHLTGTGFAGTFTSRGASFQIIVIAPGKDFYMKGSAASWKAAGAPEGIDTLLGGRWVKVPADSQMDAPFLTLPGFSRELTRTAPQSRLVARATLDGRDVALVTYSDGSMLYIARTGQPYPLRFVKAGTDATQVDFSEFGAAVNLAPPKDAVDLTTIG